jgi:hypothetical protein
VTTYVEATFIGPQDTSFHHKHTYQIQVVQRWNKKVTVVATHGYNFKPIMGMQQTYRGLKPFLQEWHVLRVVGPIRTDDGLGI